MVQQGTSQLQKYNEFPEKKFNNCWPKIHLRKV